MLSPEDKRELETTVKQLFARNIEDKVEMLVAHYVEGKIQSHLIEIIHAAKENAIKQIAAKLLKCALD